MDTIVPQYAARHDRSHTALRYILLMGVLSFFAEFTYEGSRRIVEPFLASLADGATIVGIVTGFGAWFAGNAIGILYDRVSIKVVVAFCILMELACIPFVLWAQRSKALQPR